ncbi:MAG: hypothetical protein KIT60_19345 [Burkholderiaceae bacterium]|nr:hypothetical protein [Burkholderiaceae bacterium]
MHAFILGVAAVFAGSVHAQAVHSAPCPPAHAAVLERFISAQCADCWTDASTTRASPGEWLLDWIVPSASGDDAPLSAAAPDEAADRARRALNAGIDEKRPAVHRNVARTAGRTRLTVAAGPAFNGYIGVQLDGRGRWPAGSRVWIALVESVPSGTDGTTVPRQLVRTVAGPFQPGERLSGKPWRVVQAMRWPETAKPERLFARAWVEHADGRIVAMAGERCAR